MSGYLVLFVADEADDGHADALRATARSLKGAGFFDDPDLGGQRTTGTYLETDSLDGGVERLEQRYECIGERRYDYRAPAFDTRCELVYDEFGLVLDYPDIAVRV